MIDEVRPGNKENYMRWGKQHLNWSLFIGLLSGSTLYLLLDYALWPLNLFFRIFSVVLLLAIQIWYLDHKNRNLGWLGLNLLSAAGYAFLGKSEPWAIFFLAGLVMLLLKTKQIVVNVKSEDKRLTDFAPNNL